MRASKLLAITSLLTFVLSAPMTATAGPPGGGGEMPTSGLLDLYSDFQVWVAYDITVYYVVATDANGKTTEEQFRTYSNAYDWDYWL